MMGLISSRLALLSQPQHREREREIKSIKLDSEGKIDENVRLDISVPVL